MSIQITIDRTDFEVALAQAVIDGIQINDMYSCDPTLTDTQIEDSVTADLVDKGYTV